MGIKLIPVKSQFRRVDALDKKFVNAKLFFGDARAQYMMASNYYEGEGVRQDYDLDLTIRDKYSQCAEQSLIMREKE